MFSKELTLAGHTRRYVVDTLGSNGWELRVTQDLDVVRRTCYSDWHRVERAIGTLEREVSNLEAQGWQPTPVGGSESTQSTNR
jgi:hypothetical protein